MAFPYPKIFPKDRDGIRRAGWRWRFDSTRRRWVDSAAICADRQDGLRCRPWRFVRLGNGFPQDFRDHDFNCRWWAKPVGRMVVTVGDVIDNPLSNFAIALGVMLIARVDDRPDVTSNAGFAHADVVAAVGETRRQFLANPCFDVGRERIARIDENRYVLTDGIRRRVDRRETAFKIPRRVGRKAYLRLPYTWSNPSILFR